MIKIFKTLSLKTKATIGFVVVFLIMLLSAMVGLLGLLNNSRQFDTFSKLTEQGELSNEIDSYLYAQRLAFNKYQAVNSIEFINQYKEIDVNMKNAISRLIEITKDKERIDYVEQIILKANEYQLNFDIYVMLSNNITANLNELTINGRELTDALTIMNETAQNRNDYEMSSEVTNALTHLLTARLSGSKYIDFHQPNEFDLYIANYQLFEENLSSLKGIEENINYKTEYYTLAKYIPLYKTNMELLHQNIEKLDKTHSEMDSLGPKISALTAKIKASSLEEVNTFKAQIVLSNQRNSLFVGIIFLLAIVIGSIVIIGILKLVLNPINFLKDTFESIASSDANTDFRLPETTNDEIGKMSKAFNLFMLKLKEMIEDIRYQTLLKTSETDLSEIVRLEEDMNIISNKVVSYFCKNFNMLMGAFYTSNEEGVFQLSASYAYTNRKGIEYRVEPGAGVIGQVIKERKMYIIHELPDDYIRVQSGLGNAKPNSVVVIPCLSEGELVGIIELASFKELQTKQISMLETLSEVMGRLLSTVKVRQRMKNLLDKTLHQSEELQVQQEELRQSNEELEEQARALKESEGKLQIQQEELRVTNEELETHSKQLEEQKRILDEKNIALVTTQDEMVRKAEALEKANKYKSEFLANMSHELRTPLNSILVLSQLLASKEADEPLSDKEKEFASTIHSSGKDLLTLINGVLDLSKFEAGKLQINNEKVYLTEIVTENRNMFESLADMKKLDFKISIEDGMPDYIITDSLRLNQIIKNLLSNSIKFTHKGYVSVRLRTLNNKEKALMIQPKDYIAIEVTDTGIGIPKDKQQEVFEAFKQSDGTTSRQYGGTGLGLTISLELAKLLGGNILLESEENKGSKFMLVIPRNPIPDKQQSDVLSAIEIMDNYDVSEKRREDDDDESKLANPLDRNKKRILIIEDDPTFAQILSDLAEEKGYLVTISYTGKDGIKKAKSDKPTGIILDIGLPDMDGMILAKMLSEDETTKNIPIHVISGSEDISEGDSFEGMPKSIIGFLKKPVDIKSIYKTLAKIERVDSEGRKKILVVGACGDEDFKKFTQLGQVQIHKVLTGKQAIEDLKTETYGCIILDIKLSDTNGVDFMTRLRQELDIQIPIIIYTEEEIDLDEIDNINKYAETIILKSPKSKDRLMDEVSLFLHDVERNFLDQGPVDRIILDDKSSLVGVRVLLADDDSRNVFALMHLLEQNGMRVIVAKDGFEAVMQFEKNEVDLVLMDIMMPKMDGYEAIKQIRETIKGTNTPIIALTAKAMSDDRDKCISAGANDYLTKPVEAGRLLSLIKVWMS
ncbi:response regulator [Desulfosporosinus sp.]|uniref:response regulator n=1 Tax=Desulfosporosinus sp. TaxID=157907 RepID=UPI0025C3236A|nr:response regulator [Desulfosporosinus sp.]MBC2726683.1 response regulator [Desulfosporosinus sp.]